MESSSSVIERTEAHVATAGERWSAATIAIVIVTAGIIAARFGGQVLGQSEAVLPLIYGGSLVAILVSATIARNQFKANGVPALAFLSNIFGSSALTLVPFVAIMPHVFTNEGIGNFGEQSVVWLWTLRQALFALAILAFVASEAFYRNRILSGEETHRVGVTYAIVTVLVAVTSVAGILFFHSKLPSLGDASGFSPLFHR